MRGQLGEVRVGVEYLGVGGDGDGGDEAVDHPPNRRALHATAPVQRGGAVVVGRRGRQQRGAGEQSAELHEVCLTPVHRIVGRP